MATEFLRRPLGVVDRIFNFVGGLKGPKFYDLSSPVVFTHDLSRESEFSGLGLMDGFAAVYLTNVHAVGGLLGSSFDPYAVVTFLGGSAETHRAWAMWSQIGATVASAPLTLASHFLIYPTVTGIFPTKGPRVMVNEANGIDIHGWQTTKGYPRQFQPQLIPPGATWDGFSTTTGAATIEFYCLLWVGARGARPPGIA